VATAARRTACLHVSRAMQAARRRADFDFPSRLGRRAEAGPRRVLPRVRPLCDFSKRLLDRLRKLNADKIRRGVKIVFAGFVHNANHVVLGGKFVLEHRIQLSQFQGCSVIMVLYADRKA